MTYHIRFKEGKKPFPYLLAGLEYYNYTSLPEAKDHMIHYGRRFAVEGEVLDGQGRVVHTYRRIRAPMPFP
jgi:hypothetical protein